MLDCKLEMFYLAQSNKSKIRANLNMNTNLSSKNDRNALQFPIGSSQNSEFEAQLIETSYDEENQYLVDRKGITDITLKTSTPIPKFKIYPHDCSMDLEAPDNPVEVADSELSDRVSYKSIVANLDTGVNKKALGSSFSDDIVLQLAELSMKESRGAKRGKFRETLKVMDDTDQVSDPIFGSADVARLDGGSKIGSTIQTDRQPSLSTRNQEVTQRSREPSITQHSRNSSFFGPNLHHEKQIELTIGNSKVNDKYSDLISTINQLNIDDLEKSNGQFDTVSQKARIPWAPISLAAVADFRRVINPSVPPGKRPELKSRHAADWNTFGKQKQILSFNEEPNLDFTETNKYAANISLVSNIKFWSTD